jgi:hypothetical protein
VRTGDYHAIERGHYSSLCVCVRISPGFPWKQVMQDASTYDADEQKARTPTLGSVLLPPRIVRPTKLYTFTRMRLQTSPYQRSKQLDSKTNAPLTLKCHRNSSHHTYDHQTVVLRSKHPAFSDPRTAPGLRAWRSVHAARCPRTGPQRSVPEAPASVPRPKHAHRRMQR